MKKLVEETYVNGGSKGVVLVAHSLGCIHTLRFLQQQTDEWKRRHIWAFISLGGPYGGSVKSLLVEARGSNMGIFVRQDLAFREAQRSMSSLASMMPQARLIKSHSPIVVRPEVNYTIDDFNSFFQDIGFPIGYEMMTKAHAYFDTSLGPTSVPEIYCLHGTGVPTISRLIYRSATLFRPDFPDQMPELEHQDGDGTVSWESLQLCASWPNTKHVTLKGAEHFAMIKDRRLITLLMDVAEVDGVEELDKLWPSIEAMNFPDFPLI